ncbi:CoA transferase [Nocardiopsis lambiniae]|uniref:CoA transferase n=1 Tax=Nocardiopsis lambiniae TaxID=3075539 RepID=A0ABU2M6Z5_9ACTN|nr:CoA transferase [Nocardiopsis sp. DSM 44743]MDT0328448.1 CoA transferase [Nocardiopsis sp. DSM 44743]
MGESDATTSLLWSAMGGPPDLVEGVSYRGAGPVLPARLPVRELARATVGVCSLAAAELLSVRTGDPVRPVEVDEGAVATAFVSERHLRVDGRPMVPFAPLSGFWRTADGWVRTHANYPHHRERLLAALGLARGTDADGLGRELAGRSARQVQETVYAAGGLAVAVADHPDPTRPPLVESRVMGGIGKDLPGPADLPASGVRVLDLTRVIAGPVATRTLALLGADVLRVDTPRSPEDRDTHIDTAHGKRSTLLDLDTTEDRARFEDLLAAADVVITGYRPGALDRYGLSPEDLAERRPGLITAGLCAWGWSGPRSGRRGFDSLVQAGVGIAAVEAGEDGAPGALPAQALDHGTGYALAAAVLRALADRAADGRGRDLRLSLAGAAGLLLHGIEPTPAPEGAHDPERWLTTTDSPYGGLRYARSPLGYAGAPTDWAAPPTLWGGDRPVWR